MEIPPTIVTKDLAKYVRIGPKKWKEFQETGQAPFPRYRGRDGYVYFGIDIKKFLGIIDDHTEDCQNDPFIKGLQKLGRYKE